MKTLDRRSGVQIAMKTLDQAYLGVTVREQRGAFSDYHLQVTQNISPHLTLSLFRYFGEFKLEMDSNGHCEARLSEQEGYR